MTTPSNLGDYQDLFQPNVSNAKADDAVLNVLQHYDLAISLPSPSDTLQLQKPQNLPKRLGLAFEVCAAHAVASHPKLKLLATNIVVRSSEDSAQTTLGELDMLVQDTETGTVMHWELALKFYVGVSEPLITPSGITTHWPGPRTVDCFERKYAQLMDKQIPLSLNANAQQTLAVLGLPQPTQRGLLSLGVLFQPFGAPRLALPEHCNPCATEGQWCRAGQWSSLYAQARKPSGSAWVQIPRLAQIAPHTWWDSLGEVKQQTLLQTSAVSAFTERPEMWLRPEDGSLMMVLGDTWGLDDGLIQNSKGCTV